MDAARRIGSLHGRVAIVLHKLAVDIWTPTVLAPRRLPRLNPEKPLVDIGNEPDPAHLTVGRDVDPSLRSVGQATLAPLAIRAWRSPSSDRL